MPTFLLLSLLSAFPQGLSPEEKKEAKVAFKEGAEAYQAAKFELALKDFSRAYELTELGDLLFDLAQCHKNLGHWAEAQDYYQRYVVAMPHGQSREIAFQAIAEMKQKLASGAPAPPPATAASSPPTHAVPAEVLRETPPSPTSHPRPLALVLGGTGVALGALAIVSLVEVLSFQGWKGQPPGTVLTLSSVESRVNAANTWATVGLISGIAAGAGVTGGILTW